MTHLKTLLLILILPLAIRAQTTSDVDNLYYDFSNFRLESNNAGIIKTGEKLLQLSDQLHPQRETLISFYVGNAYELEGQAEKALPLYLKVIERQPDYHVAHRAVGYIYLMESNKLGVQVNASEDPVERKKLIEAYQNILTKALPHLEKDYACDPHEAALQNITKVMKSLGEKAKPEEFDQRIAKLAGHCVTILEDPN